MKFLFSALLTTAAVVLAVPVPQPTPPGIPSASNARLTLQGLTVAVSGSGDGYNRAKFPHWSTISGKCNTRQYVLKRDGENVEVNDSCAAISGTWTSPYDGAVWKSASNVDIDHFVPLKNAWISGASSWTTDQRKAFANDIVTPQLWAVTNTVNSSKGDKSPDKWKPPLKSFDCTYAKSWVEVKSYYRLTITNDEKAALGTMLDTC